MRWIILTVCLAFASNATAEMSINLVVSADANEAWVAIQGLSTSELSKLSELDAAQRMKTLRVFVPPDARSTRTSDDLPSVLGVCSIEGEALIFRPRFPFQPGVDYRVIYERPSSNLGPVEKVVSLPKNPVTSVSHVQAIYPSADRLPQNLLKFYLHFSEPMQQGGVFRFLEIVRDDGRRLELPFLEIAEELWDPTGTRLTLLLDPGRVKRGLASRDEEGPIFEAGKHYELRISPDWRDAQGTPLGTVNIKRFTIVGEDFEQPNPENWLVDTQPADVASLPTRRTENSNRAVAIRVQFPEPLDHALLQRCLSFCDASQTAIPGTGHVSDQERTWIFQPSKPLKPGSYMLKINPILEDLAGNSIERAFETDLNQSSPTSPRTLQLHVEIR